MKKSDITIRRAKLKDVKQLIDLLVELFSIETDFTIDHEKHAEGLTRVILDFERSVILVAEQNDIIVGMVSGQLVISTAIGGYSVLLEDMCINSRFRRSGTGSALLEHLVAWGKDKGAKRIQLVADKENIAALAFYHKEGFSSSRMTGMYRIIPSCHSEQSE
jgi:ribosomal protein S18 acetylase RimI-like enzyme